jgi:threonyl-tRNA synthetase
MFPVLTGEEMKKKTASKNLRHFFPKKKMLDDYLLFLEEAKKRDHRKLGKQLRLIQCSRRSRCQD